MNEDALVRALISDLKPYKPWPRVGLAGLLMAVGVAIYAALALALGGVRPDWPSMFTNPWDVGELVLMALLMLLACRATLLRASPDGYQLKGYYRWPRYVAVLLLGVVIVRALCFHQAFEQPSEVMDCLGELLLIGLIPMGIGFGWMQKRIVLEGQRFAELLAWSGFSIAVFVLKCACDITALSHMLLAHFLPVAVAVWAGWKFGRRWFLFATSNRFRSDFELNG